MTDTDNYQKYDLPIITAPVHWVYIEIKRKFPDDSEFPYRHIRVTAVDAERIKSNDEMMLKIVQQSQSLPCGVFYFAEGDYWISINDHDTI